MIDVAAFTGPWPWRPVGMDASELAAHLGAHGIARALVTPVEGIFWADPELANERLAGALGDLPLTLVPAVDPTFPSWRRDLESSLNRRGTRAVRVFPGYRGFASDSAACAELLRVAGREGVTVIVQLRMLDARGHDPRAPYPDEKLRTALAAAASVPSCRVLLGGARFGEARGAAQEIRRLGNVWLESSALDSLDGVRSTVDAVGPERLLLGTHTPLFTTRSAIARIEEARLSPAEALAVTEANARELFRL